MPKLAAFEIEQRRDGVFNRVEREASAAEVVSQKNAPPHPPVRTEKTSYTNRLYVTAERYALTQMRIRFLYRQFPLDV